MSPMGKEQPVTRPDGQHLCASPQGRVRRPAQSWPRLTDSLQASRDGGHSFFEVAAHAESLAAAKLWTLQFCAAVYPDEDEAKGQLVDYVEDLDHSSLSQSKTRDVGFIATHSFSPAQMARATVEELGGSGPTAFPRQEATDAMRNGQAHTCVSRSARTWRTSAEEPDPEEY